MNVFILVLLRLLQLRSALDRVDELEASNAHLSKRLEKMKANRNALLAQQWRPLLTELLVPCFHLHHDKDISRRLWQRFISSACSTRRVELTEIWGNTGDQWSLWLLCQECRPHPRVWAEFPSQKNCRCFHDNMTFAEDDHVTKSTEIVWSE